MFNFQIPESVPFLIFYTFEATLKLAAYRGSYFWDPFNSLDLILATVQTASLLKVSVELGRSYCL
jgi:hypothetical protein